MVGFGWVDVKVGLVPMAGYVDCLLCFNMWVGAWVVGFWWVFGGFDSWGGF